MECEGQIDMFLCFGVALFQEQWIYSPSLTFSSPWLSLSTWQPTTRSTGSASWVASQLRRLLSPSRKQSSIRRALEYRANVRHRSFRR